LIFLFNGPPSSGKDEACTFFKEKKGFTHISFKKQLFIETCKLFDVPIDWFMGNYENTKENKVEELGGISRRQALIYTSETHIKPVYGLDYFGRKAADEIEIGVDYCFSDCGFNDEIIPIINKVGADAMIIVQLTRQGCDFSSDSRRYINGTLVQEFVLEAETPIIAPHILPDKFPIKTYRVHNNGRVESFHTILEQIHEKEFNARKINQEKGKSS
jgi:hypothetical protein